jgi:hypothetical protein
MKGDAMTKFIYFSHAKGSAFENEASNSSLAHSFVFFFFGKNLSFKVLEFELNKTKKSYDPQLYDLS